MRYLLTILLAFAYNACLLGQPSTFIFHQVGEKDGLSDNFINSLLKTRNGNIWIGTLSGLNYYDGAHFQVFRQSKDSTSLINNAVHSLCEDNAGNIWGGTDNGIFCYVFGSDKFKRYYLPEDRVAPAALTIVCDKEGAIWANNFFSIFKYDAKSDRFVRIGELIDKPDSLEAYKLKRNSIVADPTGKGLWIASRAGLHYLDKKTGRLNSFKTDPGNPLFERNNIGALHASPQGHFFYFNNYTKEIIRFDPATRRQLSRISIQKEMPLAFGATLFESSDGKIWFSSWSNELVVVDQSNGNAVHLLQSQKGDQLSVGGNFFWAAIEDEDQTVWLGTVNGISKCNLSKTIFRIHRLPTVIPDFHPDAVMSTTIEDPSGDSWWIYNSEQQLFRYYPGTQQYKEYPLATAVIDKSGSTIGNITQVVFIEKHLVICASTGVWQLNQQSSRPEPFLTLPPEYHNYVIQRIVYAGDGKIFASNGLRLLEYDLNSNKPRFVEIEQTPQSNGISFGAGLLTKKGDRPLWMTSWPGWLSYLENGKLHPVNFKPYTPSSHYGYFTCLDVDNNGNVWVANYGEGLYKYDPKTKKTTSWDQADGLAKNQLQAVLCDKNGNVWCVANNEYSVLNLSTGNFSNFVVPMQQYVFNWAASPVFLSNSHLLSNTDQDLVEFFPDRLQLKPVIKTPSISSVQIFDKKLILDNDTLLNLKPNENSVVIQFGLFTDNELFPYDYTYMLEGFDENWVVSGSQAEAKYNNMEPGDYTFMVKAIAKNNTWESHEKQLHIFIAKPFYKTWLFRLLILLLVGTGLYLFYRFRLNKHKQMLVLRGKTESLEKEKTIIQYESLKQQLNPHFLFNSLTSLRSLIKTDSKNAAKFLDGMSKIYRYVLKSGGQEMALLQDEVDFVKTFAGLQQVRFGEGLQVNIDIREEDMERYVAPVVLQNLVENAIKHNTTSIDDPLVIDIFSEADDLVIRNNLQRYRVVETSNNSGLSSLRKLYSFYTEKKIVITEDEKYFTVRIPLL